MKRSMPRKKYDKTIFESVKKETEDFSFSEFRGCTGTTHMALVAMCRNFGICNRNIELYTVYRQSIPR
jgi:hypothetical protein